MEVEGDQVLVLAEGRWEGRGCLTCVAQVAREAESSRIEWRPAKTQGCQTLWAGQRPLDLTLSS
jgi:hypothetical protein